MYNDLDLHINHYSNGVSLALKKPHQNPTHTNLKNAKKTYFMGHLQVVTVNCARIISGNQIATNGVVHVIDRVISAIGNSMQDVIEVEDDLTTLSVSIHTGKGGFVVYVTKQWSLTKWNCAKQHTFQDLAQTSGLLEKLGQPGHYTLFAPTNDAFDKLGSDVLERLQSDKEVLKGEINCFLSKSALIS